MSKGMARREASSETLVGWMIAILLGVRLVSLGLYPLMDKTEARYAEISRVMFSLGDWITPWYNTNIPFWGKPPLSFWATAASFGVLGVNEFAARLPHFLAALGVGWLVWNWARRHARQEALTAIALLAGCSLMLVAAGAVMTDMVLALGTTLTMRGFWLGLHGDEDQQRREGWLFFLGLAIGLLAKGPLVLVLAGLPLGLWTLWSRQLLPVWRKLPWVGGTLLTLLLAGPWYLAAETRTPGFLDYFLLGEHWHRFVTPGWAGDRYGGAHSARWGSIWAYAWVASLPWSVLVPVAWWRWHRAAAKRPLEPATPARDEVPLQRYLALWSLAPLVFFTFAGNILWTYVLPALPALTMLGAAWLSRRQEPQRINSLLVSGLTMSTLLFAGFVGVLNLKQDEDLQTTKRLIAHSVALDGDQRPLFFYPVRPYSAAFYSRGKARQISQPADLLPRLMQQPAYLAVKTGDVSGLPPEARTQLKPLAQHGSYTLFSMGTAAPAPTQAAP